MTMKTSQLNEISSAKHHLDILTDRRGKVYKVIDQLKEYERAQDIARYNRVKAKEESFYLHSSSPDVFPVTAGVDTFKRALQTVLESTNEGIEFYRSQLVALGFEDDVDWEAMTVKP